MYWRQRRKARDARSGRARVNVLELNLALDEALR
jgi:hypothetical protein